ncbi:MAG: hypothetical protein M3246_07135 [Actinomycetota bacterium]|nr:hypothetical protein [Actinomycetota bacterium]
MSRAGFEGKDLRATSRTVEHVIRQAVHLGMAALTRVLAQNVRQGDYLLEGPQGGNVNGADARVAADRDTSGETQLTRFAERADYGVGARG